MLSFCSEAISERSDVTVCRDLDSSVSSSAMRFLKRSRCAVIMGSMPGLAAPAPLMKPLGSKPDITDDVGETLPPPPPFRMLPLPPNVDGAIRDPATDIAEDEVAPSCSLTRSLSSVLARALYLSSSMSVLERLSCSASSCFLRS